MKLLSFFFFFLLLLQSSSSSYFPLPKRTNTLVLDTDHQPLRPGQTYYLLPFANSTFGGLSLTRRNSTTSMCPPYVTESGTTVGLPVTFSPADPNSKLIRLSSDINIAFATTINTTCARSTVWRMNFDVPSGSGFVSIGGVMGRPGPETVNNWFQIREFATRNDRIDYKLVFCPEVCRECNKVVCGDLGVVINYEEGVRVVGICKYPPLTVVFKRANTSIMH